ncbi:metallophosphoesterase family protein [Halanaerobacter jeridensis]|uniref:Phosphodiesterase n=1 Tax=Halanaerobacter jeridensis TaxID=706427 RepID=A0A938XRD1_9FIRM|nr:metallophosphoesterase [Halanaerobacter jeridensis]MBM7556030.1 putative phosphodiesterase [Halanaerobacter jeridensis]
MRKQIIGKILLITVITLMVVNFTAAKTYKLTPFDVELDLAISRQPQTTLQFPPIGELSAVTHWPPVNLKLTLKAIHEDKLEDIISDLENKEELFSFLQERGRIILRFFLLRLIFLATIAGIIGAGIVEFNYSSLFLGGTIGALIIIIISSLVYYSYDINQFQDPDFEGMLEAAPWMLGLIEEGISDIEQLSYEMQLIASNMATLFNKIDSLRPLSRVAGDIKVLHVSDIHNNPLAINFIKQIVDSFAVDMVIDTGDITDYGSPLEVKLIKELKQLSVPYIFVPGNHDSPNIIEELKKFSTVHVLRKNIIEIKGIKIAGWEDPSSLGNQVEVVAGEELVSFQQQLVKLIARAKPPPDIVAVHQFELAKPLLSKIPLLIHGHDHSFKIYDQNGTLIIDAGTTGAAGIRGLKSKKGIPYSVALLHFKKTDLNLYLKFVDIIKFYNRHSGFILERRLIE